jgi:hypothetical protein
MTNVSRSFRSLPRGLGRLAVYAIAVAQMVLGAAPILDGSAGPDARAHVETTGTRLHHAHDEADCSACLARHLLATTDIERPRSVTTSTLAATPAVDVEIILRAAHSSHTRSRAPPVVPA